jgi:hypothetical protein
MRRKCIDNNPGVGNFTPVIKTKQQAEEIQFYMLRFYSKNNKRHKQLRKAQDCEELKTTIVERPDNKLKKKQKKKKGKDEYDSLSSSSEDDENDYYDEDEAINYVPLYGAPSPNNRSPHNRSPGRSEFCSCCEDLFFLYCVTVCAASDHFVADMFMELYICMHVVDMCRVLRHEEGWGLRERDRGG